MRAEPYVYASATETGESRVASQNARRLIEAEMLHARDSVYPGLDAAMAAQSQSGADTEEYRTDFQVGGVGRRPGIAESEACLAFHPEPTGEIARRRDV